MNPIFSATWRRRAIACCALSAMPYLAFAQAPESAKRADPLDAQAPVPPLRYQSTLQTYRPLAEQEVSDWRELNDAAGRVGGWRAYAKQARQPEAGEGRAEGRPAGEEAAAPAKAGAHEHAGHKGHEQ
ncbi:hypothetical protein [Undibacterium sp.]|jgi:hypothetical protein|uniref:hypothetical protein n=1 Tax=Undibacterium sp. TaxID=1914977 RepID=UPI002C246A01|nr:hypothetical protein [Undibacterium sp.]HTD05511.1 hypothetical protein [Undibacterium sp.]